MSAHRCGLVTIAGRPNVGKSTLLNRLVGSHVSITSRRPQTTRHRVLGIQTRADAQVVYVDTPGLHESEGRALNRYMNRIARASLDGVDCVVLMISAEGWQEADEYALVQAQQTRRPVILVINKVDRLRDRAALLPLIDLSSRKMAFTAILPLSATKGTNVAELEREIRTHLPEQPPIYPEDQLTDRSERFLAAELIREQIFRRFSAEVPYSTTVQVDRFQRGKGAIDISATIWVEKDGQKAILIGTRGERLKTIGREARLAMQQLFHAKVRLQTWVKVREHWSQHERHLLSLGYREE
jgi:GTP-binding protein Era